MARKTRKKLSPLKMIAIGVVGVGAGYAIYQYILKPYVFKKGDENSTENEVEDAETMPTLPPSESNGNDGNGIVQGIINTNFSTPKNDKGAPDLDKKVKKGDKGDLVYRVQIAINKIAALRGKKSYYDQDKSKTVNFPLPTDPKLSEFADRTDSGAKFAFPSYRSNGYITLRKAREQWVRSAGYYQKPFPTELVNVSNYSDLKKIYDLNRTKKQANDEGIVGGINEIFN